MHRIKLENSENIDNTLKMIKGVWSGFWSDSILRVAWANFMNHCIDEISSFRSTTPTLWFSNFSAVFLPHCFSTVSSSFWHIAFSGLESVTHLPFLSDKLLTLAISALCLALWSLMESRSFPEWLNGSHLTPNFSLVGLLSNFFTIAAPKQNLASWSHFFFILHFFSEE